MKFKYRIIFFVIGLIGIGVMIWTSWKDLSTMNWRDLVEPETLILFAVIIATWIVIYFMHTWSYKIMLSKESKKVPTHSMFRICASGFALNNVTPAGLVGGEPYRIMALRRYIPTTKAAASTLTFTIFYAIGHFMLWITVSIIYFVLLILGVISAPIYVSIILGIAGVGLSVVFVISIICRNLDFVNPVMKLISKIPLLRRKTKPMYDKNVQSYKEIDDNIRAFRNEGWRYWLVLGLQYGSRLLEAFEYFALLWFFARGVEGAPSINYMHGLMVMGIASLVGNILFIIPMQAGSRELGTSIALSLFGIPNGIWAKVAIIYRIRELGFIIFGIILVLTGRKYQTQEAITMQEQQTETPPENKVVEVVEEDKK